MRNTEYNEITDNKTLIELYRELTYQFKLGYTLEDSFPQHIMDCIDNHNDTKIEKAEKDFSDHFSCEKTVFYSFGSLHIRPKVTTKKELISILKYYESTESKFTVNHKGKKTVFLPYRIEIENSVRESNFIIEYVSNDKKIHISCPIDWLIPDYAFESRRNLFSSEYHYFTGVSQRKLREMRIRCFVWHTTNSLPWYGGNNTLICEEMIQNIMAEYLK